MSKYNDLLTEIQEGRIDQAMERMYFDEDLQKISAAEFKRWSALRAVLTWEDVLCESIKRLMDKAVNGTKIVNFKFYFWGICRNYCKEMDRLKKKDLRAPEYVDNSRDALFLALQPFVQKLGGQCALLLGLIYFHNPVYDPKQRETLVEILDQNGYKVKPSSISTLISRCKRNLKNLIGNQLDDFEEAYNL